MKINDNALNLIIKGLYKEKFPGVIRDMKFEIRHRPSGGASVDIHVLLNDEVYRNSMSDDAGGFFVIMDMEEKISSALNYLQVRDVDFFKYLDSSEEDMQRWNQKFYIEED